SNCSSEKPTGSISRWQLAQVALERCSARRSRMGRFAATVFSFNDGTLAGGGGGGVPRRFSRIHLPRITGEVRVAYDVTVRILPWRSSPPRSLSESRLTRRK